MCEKLHWRFGENDNIFWGLNCLQPQHDRLDITLIELLSKHYSCGWDSLAAEMKLLPKVLQRYENDIKCKVTTTLTIAEFLENLQIAFQDSYNCVIALTIPTSSAVCECTFSCLCRLKTYLQYPMSDKRLMNLAVLAVEKATAKSLDQSDIVTIFDVAHHNRQIRLH